MTTQDIGTVPPKSLEAALDWVRRGGRLYIHSYTRPIIIDAKALESFERVGQWLLKEDSDGYRLRQGKGSVYLLPGQLKFID